MQREYFGISEDLWGSLGISAYIGILCFKTAQTGRGKREEGGRKNKMIRMNFRKVFRGLLFLDIN